MRRPARRWSGVASHLRTPHDRHTACAFRRVVARELIEVHTDFANTTITAHRVTLEDVEASGEPTAEAAGACCVR